MSSKQKKKLIRIIIAIILFAIVFTLDKIFNLESVFKGILPSYLCWLFPFTLYFAIYIYIGYDVLRKFFLNVINLQMLDENFLMTVATIGAFSLGIYSGLTNKGADGFEEGCAVLIFYQIGQWIESYAVRKSRNSIKDLMNIRPDYANLLKDGSIEIVDPSEVKIDDVIVINPGEKVPLDGVIIEGNTAVDTAALTGESKPRDLAIGDKIISGSVNLTSTIKVKVETEFYNSTVSKILDLVENASTNKSKAESFITRFAKYYTPIVVICALILAIIPPTLIIIINENNTFDTWIYRALSFLVVSCPCALVISVPMSFFAGIGSASKKGVLVKGSNYLELVNKIDTFVFDKTGTLTKGNFKVTEVYPEENKAEILNLAAICEKGSSHPIAASILSEISEDINNLDYEIVNVAGQGIIANKESKIYCGNEKLMEANNINYIKANSVGSVVYVAKDNEFVGYIVVSDQIKEESRDVIQYLNKTSKTVMLTGDSSKVAEDVYNKLGLSDYKSELLPQDKVANVEELKKNSKCLAFIGDGINDAPVLMLSDVGISMGNIGSDAAIEASDIVLMHGNLNELKTIKKISKKVMRIVYENITFALVIKIGILILAALGYANMWLAVFGDVGVAVLCILNALRSNRIK